MEQREPMEIRIELQDIAIQELLWRVLLPDGRVKMRTFTEALRHHNAEPGVPPPGMLLGGVSVTIEGDRVFAELSYVPAEGQQEREAGA